MAELVRLQRFLATGGVAARRKAEALIVEGRVQVNGKVVTVLGTKIDPDRDDVLVDGEAVVALDRFYVLFNKPKGCITAVTDDRGRPVVMDYLPNLPVPVKPVGRLDFYTEGVLLLTNDGELAARLLAPGNHVPKTYHVKVHGQLGRDEIQRLREGITLDDGVTTMPAEVEVLPGESKYTWLAITIHEGKHRQIHRMIEALGYVVDKLQRVAFATLTFHNLRIGDARELTQQELNDLRDTVGLDHSAVARGRWRSDRESTDIARRARAKARAEAEAEAEEREANRLANVARRAAAAGDGDDDSDPADIDDQVWSAEDGEVSGGGYDDEADDAPPARGPRGGRASSGRGNDRGSRDDRGARSSGPRSDARGSRGAPARGRDDRGAGRSAGGRGEGRSFGGPRTGGRSDERGAGRGGATRTYGARPGGRSDERSGGRSGGATRTYGARPGVRSDERGGRGDERGGRGGSRSFGAQRPQSSRGEGRSFGAPSGGRSEGRGAGGRSEGRGAGGRGEGRSFGAQRPQSSRGEGRSFGAPSGGRGEGRGAGGRGEGRSFGAQRPQSSRGEGRSFGARPASGAGRPSAGRPSSPRGSAAPRGAASARAGSFGSTKPGRSFGAAKPAARGSRDSAPRAAAPRGKGAGARAPQRGRKR